jgi:hypothetical protein
MLRPLLILALLTSTTLADTWTVDDDGKADFDNIQAAVDASSDASDRHGANCISEIDQLNIKHGLMEYIEKFGPLSIAPERGLPDLFPIFPIGGTLWKDLPVSNYVDLDPSSGELDWNCGNITNNGHKGSDTRILSWNHQLVGIPIVSVLDGVVIDTHDGEPDMNTTWEGQPANYVIVDHGQGRLCYYWHMKQWSVIVTTGQQVSAGEQLGMVASSGNSTTPHLHFETRDSNSVVEPYTGDCNSGQSQWVDQIDIPIQTYCTDFAVTTQDLSEFYAENHHRWRPPAENQIPLDYEYVRFWMRGINLPPQSTIRYQFFFPSGAPDFDSGELSIGSKTEHWSTWYAWKSWNIADMHKTTGTWTVVISINEEPFITVPVEVVETVDLNFNRPPENISASISASPSGSSVPTPEDVLTCRLTTDGPLGDLDWDLVRYQYIWFIDGFAVRNVITAGTADHLPRQLTNQGDLVSCMVAPFDGIEFGTTSSDQVIIAIEDCNGNYCPATWVGDGYCDDGSYSWNGIPIYLNCEEFECDGGDCICGNQTWTVDDDGKADFDNIQAAVDASSNGDEIIVMPGTYPSTQDGHVVNMLGKAVTLRSSDPSDPDVVAATIIDGENTRRGLACFNEETSNTIISGFTITNGYGVEFDYNGNGDIDLWENDGGGMLNYENSNPTLTNCTFTNNSATIGGGILNSFSNPRLIDCTLINNSAGNGGGIGNSNSSPTLINCTFTNNTAFSWGAGMWNGESTPSLFDCEFIGNTTIGYGGGGMLNYASAPVLTGCTFTKNIATRSGGMGNWNSSPKLTHCLFINNTTEFYGGGMGNLDGSKPELENCTFENNTTNNEGGGMYNDDSSPTLTDCTFTNNSAENSGGGMCNYNRTFGKATTLNGCTFTNNTSSNAGGGMYNYNSSPTLNGCTFTTNIAANTMRSLVQKGTPRGINGGGGMNNDYSSPTMIDCTFTGNISSFDGGGMCNNSSSPTLVGCTLTNNTSSNAGGGMFCDNSSSPTLTDTTVCGNTPDQINGDWTDDGGNTVADECPIDCPDINGDDIVNVNDILILIGNWGSNSEIGDVNDDGIVDVSDLLIVVGNWGACE